MAVESRMIELGSHMPALSLPDVRSGGQVSADDLARDANVVVFLCNHCPYVKHIAQGLAAFGHDHAGDERVAIVAISSNDPEQYPDDAPAELARVSDEVGYPFPVLFDEDQSVAAAFSAACTPDVYVFDRQHRLTYRGQFDGSRPNNGVPVTGESLRAAVAATLKGEPVADQRPSIGCSIKWKPGNEPAR